MAILKIKDKQGNTVKYRASIQGIGSIKINGKRFDSIEDAIEDEKRLRSERDNYYNEIGHRKNCRRSKYVRIDTLDEIVQNAEALFEIIEQNNDIYTTRFAIDNFIKSTKPIVERITKEKQNAKSLHGN